MGTLASALVDIATQTGLNKLFYKQVSVNFLVATGSQYFGLRRDVTGSSYKMILYVRRRNTTFSILALPVCVYMHFRLHRVTDKTRVPQNMYSVVH